MCPHTRSRKKVNRIFKPFKNINKIYSNNLSSLIPLSVYREGKMEKKYILPSTLRFFVPINRDFRMTRR
jgi:hypothetical protein